MKLTIPRTTAEAGPINYYCLIDNSGSIKNSVRALKDTMRAIVSNMTSKDTITIGTFSSHKDYEFFVRGSSNTDRILELLESKICARGLTCFNDSLDDLQKIVADVSVLTGNDNSYFYFLSDGYANHFSPESVTLSICKNLSSKFTNSLIIGYGNYYNRTLLLDMANSLGGSFNHVSKFAELEQTGNDFSKSRMRTVKVNLGKCYDYVWQVTDSDIYVLKCEDGEVNAIETVAEGELFAIDESEITSGSYKEHIRDPKFVYSLAYILSQRNKANLGVQVLRNALDIVTSKKLQKAFTVSQKGVVEQELKKNALFKDAVDLSEIGQSISLDLFLNSISENLGKVIIDNRASEYKPVTSKGETVSVVETINHSYTSTIVGITRNENRANVSFLAARPIVITKVTDPDVLAKVDAHNARIASGELDEKLIQFPIHSTAYRNYTLVADGNFAFEKLVLEFPNSKTVIHPEKDIDIFDDSVRSIHIKDFAERYKQLIANKAHASVIRWYIKNNSTQKHYEDKRVINYGPEGAKILEEIGLNYDMVYSAKTVSPEIDKDTADYVPYVEITAQLKGASAISASKSYEKYTKKGKPNPGDEICFKYFEVYDKMLASLGKEEFVRNMQLSLKGVEDRVDKLVEQISMDKFYLRSTNSWFEGVEKEDEFLYDGVLFKVKETREYL